MKKMFRECKGSIYIIIIVAIIILLFIATILFVRMMVSENKNIVIENENTVIEDENTVIENESKLIEKSKNLESLKNITSDNYGDYIDLETNIVGLNTTDDDWRILYNDTENEKIYAILADYLPNDTKFASKAGLDTEGDYGVFSNTDAETLLNGFDSNVWNDIVPDNLKNYVNVKGAVDVKLLINSYNEKHSTNLDYTKDFPRLYANPEDYSNLYGIEQNVSDELAKEYDELYTPHKNYASNCWGYWLNSELDEDGYIKATGIGAISGMNCNNSLIAIRPVAILSYDTPITKTKSDNDIIWKIAIENDNTSKDTKLNSQEQKNDENSIALEQINSDNYGDYIDLGKNIVGDSTTDDDWRILYNDTENKKIYAILSDYLPNSTGIPSKAGLDTDGKYSVYAENNPDTGKIGNAKTVLDCFQDKVWKDTLISSNLKDKYNIDVKGAVEAKILMASYNSRYDLNEREKLSNEKNATNMYSFENDTLYIPHAYEIENCDAYYLASEYNFLEISYDFYLRSVGYHDSDNVWKYGFSDTRLKNTGVRPIAIIPSNIMANRIELDNKILWEMI